MKPNNLINRQVKITDHDSPYYGHWGYVKNYDGDLFHISGGSISTDSGEITAIFDRDQFKIVKTKK